MKRVQLLIVAALMALCISTPSYAARSKSKLKVINQSKWEIHELYFSPANSRHWGPDQLEDEVLSKGESLTLTNIACGRYDIKVVDEDGDECVIENERLCGNNAFWKITDQELLSCEGSGSED